MQELINLKQWVMWKLTPVEGRPKPTKVPYSVTGVKASSTDPNSWSDYHTALAVAKAMGMDGVGFVFSKDDPYFFIDVDNCLDDNGNKSQLAIEISQQLFGCYVEISQSGHGLHFIGKTKTIPDWFKSMNNQELGLEIYTQERFIAMTCTGHGSENLDMTMQFNAIVSKYAKKRATADEWTNKPRAEYDGPESDEELIKLAMSSNSANNIFGDKASFKDLWTKNEDKLATTYPADQGESFNWSSADMALCSHLAFWTGCDCERMERLFNQSALVRGKWTDREDYRRNTILHAVSNCTTVYKKLQISQETINNVVNPVQSAIPNYMNISPGEGAYGTNHSANATTFIQNYYRGDTLIFNQDQAFRYTGKVWERVSDEELKYQLSIAMLASEPKADNINGTYKMMSWLQTRVDRVMGTYNGKPVNNLVICQNGILDVTTGDLKPHDPLFFTTSILPYSYDPFSQCPTWFNFLNSTLENDEERIALLQEWIGYMMINNYDYQKAMLLIGAPRSGKSTIGKIIQQLIGEQNFAGASLEGLANDAVLAELIDKQVIFIGDAHSVSGNNRNAILTNFKSITGCDPITINRKYKTAWNGKLPGRIMIAANNIPSFADDSGAMANRLLILPFNKSFLGKEDHTLEDRLLKELPGICNWALEGLRRLRRNNRFTEPEASKVERKEIEYQQAPLMAFFDECCEIDINEKVTTEDLFNRYKAWKILEGGGTMTQNTFVRAMRSTFRGKIDKRPQRIDGVTRQCFIGIKLKSVVDPMNVVPFKQQEAR
ncbi:DNA primase [Proteus phage vB_PmiP_RS10pmA]|nr:DNA primase [Proteus phage vB_PmiP_RS10pmA]